MCGGNVVYDLAIYREQVNNFSEYQRMLPKSIELYVYAHNTPYIAPKR